MFKYFLKRISFAALALFILLCLVFFLMQAVPGYPIDKPANYNDQQYEALLRANGLLDNSFVQFGKFLKGFFTKGSFGIYYSNGSSVTEVMLNPIKYTLMIAGPAFVLSSIIGVILGIISAYYRGRWPDILINAIAVLFISIPSFVLALYLIQLAGVIGLPTNFIPPESNEATSAGKVIESMIVPILSMTLSSISMIVYYTRNELVEVFKQEYVKTALAKGYSFRTVVFKYAMRNAAIPIVSILAPSFVSIISGSIIIEKFFNVPGTASKLLDAIIRKETNVVLFAAVFYSSIYFMIQILADISYSFIDPRIVLAEKSSYGLTKKVGARFSRKYKSILINQNSFLNRTFPNLTNKLRYKYFAPTFVDAELEDDDYTDNSNLFSDVSNDELDSLLAINSNTETQIQNTYAKIDAELFKEVDIFALSHEQVSGKPTTYLKDICRRFFKSKTATFFTIVFGFIVIFSLITSLCNLNTLDNAITDLPAWMIAYLPPRIPWLGINGITDIVVDGDTLTSLIPMKELYPGLYLDYQPIGSSFLIKDYNPYILPGLGNITLMAGTDGIGRDWWTLLWYSTLQSLVLSIIVAVSSVVIGTIYGAVAGSRAGKMSDIVLMRIVEILSGVPLILWILIFGLVFSGGNLSLSTVCISLILVSWMWPAVTARTYIIKYKDAEFVQAAKTLGASEARILFSHLLPNIAGRLTVVLVNQIPKVIFFEASLVFLGVRASTDISLGTMIETARTNPYWFLMLGPALMIVIITLSAQLISNHLNDSLDPKVSGE